jgi:hypothetical protein
MSKIRLWLESQGLGQYTQAFEANDIEVELVPELTDEALRQLGVSSLGHRLRLLAAAKSANVSLSHLSPLKPPFRRHLVPPLRTLQ